MKVCVYGAGAIGGHLAGRLARGGAEVSVVVRGANLEAIRARGLRVHGPGEDWTCHPAASDDPAELGPQDLVLVATKAPALPSVAANIAPLLGPDTPVAFFMNGIPWWYWHAHGGPNDGATIARLDPHGTLADTVGMRRAIGGVVYSSCTVTEPGTVHVEHARNRLVVGEPDGSLSPRVLEMAALLEAGGIRMEVTPRIRDAVWAKLLLNLGSGMLGVLTSSPPAGFYVEPAAKEATRSILAEGARLAAAMGCTVTPDVEGQIDNGTRSNHRTSILQDLDLGRPMEIDALYSVPLEMARAAGVATPVLDLMAAMVRTRARAAGLYAASPSTD